MNDNSSNIVIHRKSNISSLKPSKDNPQSIGSFLCFYLGDEEYGIDLLEVNQIVMVPPVAWVPRVKPHFLGVISIRGGVVTLVDTRRLLGFEPSAWPKSARVILMKLNGEQMGFLVDKVTQVRHIEPAVFEEKPCLDDVTRTEKILGIARPSDGSQIVIVSLRDIISEVLR